MKSYQTSLIYDFLSQTQPNMEDSEAGHASQYTHTALVYHQTVYYMC